MPIPKSEMMKRVRAKKKENGLRKLPDKYVNKEFFDTYNEQVDKTIKRIDKQLNKFDTGE